MAKLKKDIAATVADETSNTTSDATTTENSEVKEPTADSEQTEQSEPAKESEEPKPQEGDITEKDFQGDEPTTASEPPVPPVPTKTSKQDKPTNILLKQTQEKSEKKDNEEPDSHTLGLLKAFKEYESLYIDRSGSVYTIDTPERIRGGAKLYTNPYHTK